MTDDQKSTHLIHGPGGSTVERPIFPRQSGVIVVEE